MRSVAIRCLVSFAMGPDLRMGVGQVPLGPQSHVGGGAPSRMMRGGVSRAPAVGHDAVPFFEIIKDRVSAALNGSGRGRHPPVSLATII